MSVDPVMNASVQDASKGAGDASSPTFELNEGATNEGFVGDMSLVELAQALDQHKLWVESGGAAGRKADLTGADLAGADLTGANLQDASLHRANLRGADLSLANLRGASLVQADMQETNLLGTELRGANLMGASLLGASGLWYGRLGGANLFGAVLPDSAFELDGTRAVAQATKTAHWYYLALLSANLLLCCMVAATSDLHLLLNSPALPIPALGDALPMTGFYLSAPILLFVFYLRVHFLLLGLWENVASLPSVFPDGQTLESSGPWYLMALARGHFRWLRGSRSPFAAVETLVAMLLAYWVGPLTLVFFWARYLTRQDSRGTFLHAALVVAAVAVAAALPSVVARVLRPWRVKQGPSRDAGRIFGVALGAAVIAGCILGLLSLGILRGAPQDTSRSPAIAPSDPRRWAAQTLWLAGYNPYADLTDVALTARPANANLGDEELARVPGASLSQISSRYARGYRAYLVNAKLWRANLEGAYFSEADLRGANLREATLRYAALDRVRADHAVFVGADAGKANLTEASLRGGDLSYVVFEDALLVAVHFEGARLYGANLRRARLNRAIFERADLREAVLENADLTRANLHEADLSSAKLSGANLAGAQLHGAILLEANLKNAGLGGAVFTGAVLGGAAFDGADISGADLRGALGLTAEQVCSSSKRRGALLDAGLVPEVEHLCGAGR